MSDTRINNSPRPIPEQTEATEAGHPQLPASARLDTPKSPDAEYNKAMESGLAEHLLHQHSAGSGDNPLSNAVEAGMQSASEWLLQHGKLMQSELQHTKESEKHADCPTHDSSVQKK